MHGSDEYMFSQKYIEGNGNTLLNSKKKTENTLGANLNIDLSSHNEKSLMQMQQHTMKRLNTLKRLSSNMGIKLGAVDNA